MISGAVAVTGATGRVGGDVERRHCDYDHPGVRRVAYLSSIDADPLSPFCYGRTNGDTEQMLLAAIDDVRIVRAGLFTDFVHALMGEDVRLPDAGRFATVTREEAADALAEAVLDDGPSLRTAATASNRSFAEIAAEIGRPFAEGRFAT